MATMYQKCMQDLVTRIADQAVELAKVKEQNELNAKNAAYWQQRAIDLGFQVDELRRERDKWLHAYTEVAAPYEPAAKAS